MTKKRPSRYNGFKQISSGPPLPKKANKFGFITVPNIEIYYSNDCDIPYCKKFSKNENLLALKKGHPRVTLRIPRLPKSKIPKSGYFSRLIGIFNPKSSR